MNTRNAIIFTLIVCATMARLLPHPENFTPLLAVALFAGRKIEHVPAALSVVVLSMLVIDLPLWFGLLGPALNTTLLTKVILINLSVYASIAGLVSIAHRTRCKRGGLFVAAGSLAGAMLFFVITNFASWLAFYPQSWAGLANCYQLAIPYFKNTWLSTLLYSGILFGCLAMWDRQRGPSATSKQPLGNPAP